MYTFLKDQDEDVRAELAGRGALRQHDFYTFQDLPKPVKARLSTDKPKVQKNLIRYQKDLGGPDEPMMQRFIQGPTEVQSELLQREDVPPSVVEQFSENPALYKQLVKRTDVPTHVLKKIAYLPISEAPGDSRYDVLEAKRELAKRPNLPIDWIVALVETGNEDTMKNLAEYQNSWNNPKLQNTLKKMLSKESTQIDKALAYNVNIPTWVPQQLLQSPDWEVREGVILTFGLPKELIDYLAKDDAVEYRKAIAKTPLLHTSPEAMLTLAKDRSSEVKAIIAERDDITRNAAMHLLSTGSEPFLYGLARSDMSQLSAQDKDYILQKIASTDNTRLLHQLGGARKDLTKTRVEKILMVIPSMQGKHEFISAMEAQGKITPAIAQMLKQQGFEVN